MGRTKNKARRNTAKPLPESSTEPSYTPAELIAKSEELLSETQFSLAYKLLERALSLCAKNTPEELKCFELLGVTCIELQEFDAAKSCFENCLQRDPFNPYPLLQLAQIADTPEDAVRLYEKALELFKAKIEGLGGRMDGNVKECSQQEGEYRRSASTACVAVTELYLTDLCQHEDAEQKSEAFLTLGSQFDSTDPEIHSTLASLRISQQRKPEASEILTISYNLWNSLPEDSPAIPTIPARVSLSKLFMEVENFEDAVDVLEGCAEENDEDPEVGYLLGLAWFLLGKARAGMVFTEEDDKDNQDECWAESKEVLQALLQLNERQPGEVDPDVATHATELIAVVEGRLREEDMTAGGDWEDVEMEE